MLSLVLGNPIFQYSVAWQSLWRQHPWPNLSHIGVGEVHVCRGLSNVLGPRFEHF